MKSPDSVEKRVVVVLADDQGKSEVIDLLRAWRERLEPVRFVATRDTGNLVRSRLGLDVELVESGAWGGACQLAALVVTGVAEAAIVLCKASLHAEQNVTTVALHRVCDIHNVPFASNVATANAVLGWLIGNPNEDTVLEGRA